MGGASFADLFRHLTTGPPEKYFNYGEWQGSRAPLNANTTVKSGNRRVLIEDRASVTQSLLLEAEQSEERDV